MLRHKSPVGIQPRLALARLEQLAKENGVTLGILCRAIGLKVIDSLKQDKDMVMTAYGHDLADLLGKDILTPDFAPSPLRVFRAEEVEEPKPEPELSPFAKLVMEQKREREAATARVTQDRRQALHQMAEKADMELDRRRKESKGWKQA